MEKVPEHKERYKVPYTNEMIHMGYIDRYIKEGVSFLTANLHHFCFWLIASHIIWVSFEFYTAELSLLPPIIKAIPHKKLLIASAMITGFSAFISCLLKRFYSKRSDFPLLKLFPKNSTRQFSKTSRS